MGQKAKDELRSSKEKVRMSNIRKSKPSEVQGGKLTSLDHFWLETVRNAAKESVSALEEAAKQMITITSLLQGIYFAAISFSDIKKALGQFTDIQGWLITGALLLPLLLWIISLAFAVLVFKPRLYLTNLDSPDVARKSYEEIITYKHQQLQRSHLMLVLGFVSLIGNVVLFWRF